MRAASSGEASYIRTENNIQHTDTIQPIMHTPVQNVVQRKCAHCEAEEKMQRKPLQPFIQKKEAQSSNVASDAVSSQIRSAAGSGKAISSSTKSFMESRFGADFSNVNIHTGNTATELSAQLNAQAFTVGNDIYFNEGKYAPESANGKRLLAHELTHTIQQKDSSQVQRSCSDGKCDSCTGGKKDFWMTVYFRREADAKTVKAVDKEMAEAKTILAKCCLDLKYDLKKDKTDQVAGSAKVDAFKPATATDRWRYTADETALGTGKTFDSAKGVPLLVVDDVPLSGGGVTVDKKFDSNYTGKGYAILGLNQTSTPNPNCNHTAHELWHVGGTDKHDPANGAITACTGNSVSNTYCNDLRAMV
jgi:hypothetical protein